MVPLPALSLVEKAAKPIKKVDSFRGHSLNMAACSIDFCPRGVSEVHHMPCEVDYNGSTEMNIYFKPSEVPEKFEKDGSVTAHEVVFRGRCLQGRRVPLPGNARGLVLSSGDGGSKEVNSTFDHIMHWNYGKNPSNQDRIPRVLNWFETAHAIHDD